MTLDIGAALRDGAGRTLTRTGALLMAGFAVLGLTTVVLQQNYLSWYFAWVAEMGALPAGFEAPTLPLAFGIPPELTALGTLVTALLAEAFRIVAVRTMVGDHPDSIPLELATRNIGLATLNGFVGGVVVLVLIGLGSLLVVPGIFLAVAFVFVRQEIAVRDVNFVDAMVGSWELTAGDRIELLVLGVVWVTLLILVFLVGNLLGLVLPSGSPVGPVVDVLLGAPVTVFIVASVARAYVQLEGGRGDEAGTPDEGDDDEEEWPDPPGVDV